MLKRVFGQQPKPEATPALTLEAGVRAALAKIVDPATGKDIVAGGNVQGLSISETGIVNFILEVDAERGPKMEPLRRAAVLAVEKVKGVSTVQAVLTSAAAAPSSSSSPAKPAPTAPEMPKTKKKAPDAPTAIPGVKRIIAVSSGKGGVGKSTVAANLAALMAAQGFRVGLLDADVFGPSQPKMLGLSGKPASPDGKIIIPLINHDVTAMSIGLMTDPEQAIIWRGPMLIGALQQMLLQVEWTVHKGELDVLFVDLPPGTGDVQMTLGQKVPVTGAVVVSTPQDIALIDARKGISMFQRMSIPVLGIIENMASFVCGACGTTHHPFGEGGAAAEAQKQGVQLLGALPLELATRVAADSGTPIVLTEPEGAQATAFGQVIERLVATHEWQNA